MSYKVIIPKIEDERTATQAAEMIAPFSSLDADKIQKYMQANSIAMNLADIDEGRIQDLIARLQKLGVTPTLEVESGGTAKKKAAPEPPPASQAEVAPPKKPAPEKPAEPLKPAAPVRRSSPKLVSKNALKSEKAPEPPKKEKPARPKLKLFGKGAASPKKAPPPPPPIAAKPPEIKPASKEAAPAPVKAPPPPPLVKPVQPKPIRAMAEEEEEDCPSNFENLVKNVGERKDLFEIERERKMLGTLLLSLIIGISCGFWFNGLEFVDFSPDFFERLPPERTAKLVIDVPLVKEEKQEKVKKKKKEKKELQKKKQKPKPKGSGKGGKGDPRARITRKGVLGIISARRKGAVVGRDLLGKSFAKDIDNILENIGGLKKSGSGGKGRKGLAGIGFGKGYGTGFGGSGGIDDIMGGLLGGAETISLKRKRGKLEIKPPKTISAGPRAGGRTQEQIMRVVLQHIPGLRYAYNKRLKQKPNLRGKITVRFKIDPSGSVISATVVGSTMRDKILEKEIISQILRWRFDPVQKKGIDEVEYPFAFSQ